MKITIGIWLGLLWIASQGGNAVAAEPPRAESPLRVTYDGSRLLLALQTSDATLERIGLALGRATGSTVEVDEPLRNRRLTLDLRLRPPERLFRVLARRADAWLFISYRLKPLPTGAQAGRGSLAFASQRVNLAMARPASLRSVLEALAIRAEVEEGVEGHVRLSATQVPLAQVLDRIAGQVNARWETRIRLRAHSAPDAQAEADERRHAHFADLVELSPTERREELMADLEVLEQSPPEERAKGILGMADDVLSLATLLQEVPGEHRATVQTGVLAVSSDYAAVLARLPQEQQQEFEPVLRALSELQQRLAQIR